MNTIVKKILIITIGIAVIVFSSFAALNTITFSNAFKKSIDDKVYNETEKFSNQISMIFENAEGAIDTLATEVSHHFDMKKQMMDKTYINQYIGEFSPVMEEALTDIEDAQGLYLTFNPEITDKKQPYEIWYSYDENGNISYTDASIDGVYQNAFEDKTRPNMQYYFNAVDAAGEGLWTEPYMDPDIEEEVIAYSEAVYSDNTLIGVIGTDISTKHTTQLISDMKVEHNGMVILLDTDNNIICTSSKVNEHMSAVKKMIINISDDMEDKSSGIFSESWNGEEMHISFSELSNGWKLAIINYERELYKPYYHSFILAVVLAILSIVVLLAVIFFAGRKVTSPIDKAVSMLKLMDLDHQVEEKDKRKVKDEDDILMLVDKAVKRQRTNDMMLSNQSKLATVGEMMANVTHQWKQPLNNINIVMGNLKDDVRNEMLDTEDVLYAVRRVEQLTMGMSETLKDFYDYLKPDTELVQFEVGNVTHAALDLLADKIKAKNINVLVKQEELLFSYGYKNSFYHVVLNVLNNAIDAIEEQGTNDGIIEISINKKSDKISIEIYDNGVKMSEATKSNLFDPYYTTKENGTGLGLAIAKQIIEGSMKGRICMENCNDGVKCTIEIGVKEDKHDK